MSPSCCDAGRTTYADIYNSAFTARDRQEWFDDQLTRLRTGHCIRCEGRVLRYVSTAFHTQTIFETLRGSKAASRELTLSSENASAVRLMRTRRLARRMLQHAYRPGGRMFRSTMATLARSLA